LEQDENLFLVYSLYYQFGKEFRGKITRHF